MASKRFIRCALVGLVAAWTVPSGCSSEAVPSTENGGAANNGAGSGVARSGVWAQVFDAATLGGLSAVWGSGADDVFVAGGDSEQGVIQHFDGQDWQAMTIPNVPRLTGLHGFGSADVFAVGEGGAVLHYDGIDWRELDAGTDRNLKGVWGATRDDLWIVGGDIDSGSPILLNFNGIGFAEVAVPDNDRDAFALFAVWGFGSRIFAVGSDGLIIERAGGAWRQAPTGPAADDDFLAISGTSETNMVVVGGRREGRISVYDGVRWRTQLAFGIEGLNGVHMIAASQAIIGGGAGYLGDFDPLTNTLAREASGTDLSLQAIWGDGSGGFYAVGGSDTRAAGGVVLMRTPAPATDVAPPDDDATPPDDTTPPVVATLDVGVSAGETFVPFMDGDTLTLVTVDRDQVEVVLTFRSSGFEPDGEVTLTGNVVRTADGSSVVNPITLNLTLVDVESGLAELRDLSLPIDNATPADVADQELLLFFVMTSRADPSISASVLRSVVASLPSRR